MAPGSLGTLISCDSSPSHMARGHSCTISRAQRHTLTQRGKAVHTGTLACRHPHAHTCTPCHSAHLCSPLCLFTPLRWKTWLKPGEERDTWNVGATA